MNTNEAFCTVVQTRLADHRLLFSGEVDCREESAGARPPPSCYVELKTSAEICTPKQRSNFHRCCRGRAVRRCVDGDVLSSLSLNCGDLIIRFKLLKWWAQSFLPGVPRVVAGFRDHDGVVVAIEDFPVSKMSHLAKVRLFAATQLSLLKYGFVSILL